MSVSTSSRGDAAIGREKLADEERIKKALQKTTGFPLEQEIANVLLSRNHVVFGNKLFEDGGGGSGRLTSRQYCVCRIRVLSRSGL